MQLVATVLAEDTQVRDNVEYVTITCIETGDAPLLQTFDYSLRADERIHKGKLCGKQVMLHVNTIRSIFSGRPQMVGRMQIRNGAPATK